MKHLKNVAIVGVGLIGGSIGMALRQRGLADTVVGIGRRQVELRIARRVGAVTHTTIDLAKGVAQADLVIVCTPVGHIVEQVRAGGPALSRRDAHHRRRQHQSCRSWRPWTRVCRAAAASWAAIRWPAAKRPGPGYATANLFDGRMAIITPTRNTRAEDFDLMEEFWEALGSVVVRMSPEEHDRALAITSHLPHLVAAALAATVPEQYFRLGGTGMLDATRLAGGDPGLWKQILLQNRDNILTALEQYGAKLSAIHAALRNRNEAELERWLTTAKKNRDALGS